MTLPEDFEPGAMWGLPAGSSESSGAVEHAGASWGGDIAFANIGLPRSAVRGKRWRSTYRPTLQRLFTELLRFSDDVVGLCLCKVGNPGDLLDDVGRAMFEEVIEEMCTAVFGTT